MVTGSGPKRATSADVARESGLSRATVSYVLNNDPHQKIPEVTRQRVLDAARRLDYTPSAAARMLRSGRSDVVLCLLPDWPMGPSLGALLEHLAASLEAHELTLLLHPRVHSTRPTAALWRSISPAAVLLFEDLPQADRAAIEAVGAKIMVSALSGPTSGTRPMLFTEERVGRVQLEHLAAQGHRHIGYGYPDDERVQAFAKPRLDGVRMACADLELDLPDVQVVPLDPVAAGKALMKWRSADPPVTAVCAYNDEVAMAILAAAIRAGVAVPGELAVIGVDDIPSASLTQPPLTSVARDAAHYAETITTTIVRNSRVSPRCGDSPTPDLCMLFSANQHDSHRPTRPTDPTDRAARRIVIAG